MKKELTNRMKELTPNQEIYFEAIIEHIREFHSFPTCIDLANTVGVTNNAAYEMINRLCRKGFIEMWRDANYRVVNVTFEPKFQRNERTRTAV